MLQKYPAPRSPFINWGCSYPAHHTHALIQSYILIILASYSTFLYIYIYIYLSYAFTCPGWLGQRIKGTVQRDFRPLVFFHQSNQPWILTNGFKYFQILFRFRRDIRILVSKKLTPRSMILRQVKKKLILGLCCKNEKFSLF